jgi:hypothetical protein
MQLREDNIAAEIRCYQQKWRQHVMRTPMNTHPRCELTYKPLGKRHLERPRMRWTDQRFLASQRVFGPSLGRKKRPFVTNCNHLYCMIFHTTVSFLVKFVLHGISLWIIHFLPHKPSVFFSLCVVTRHKHKHRCPVNSFTRNVSHRIREQIICAITLTEICSLFWTSGCILSCRMFEQWSERKTKKWPVK